MPRHEEARCEVRASPADVFDHIDRPERLSSHMSRKSWRLGGGSMSIETDAQGGRAVGSHIWQNGRMLGLSLRVECVVSKRIPNQAKEWETVGTPSLLVVGPYRMSVGIVPRKHHCVVTIAIDYGMPSSGWERILGSAFGPIYARWCVRQMARDLAARFAYNDHQT
jgi:hypothetical protein